MVIIIVSKSKGSSSGASNIEYDSNNPAIRAAIDDYQREIKDNADEEVVSANETSNQGTQSEASGQMDSLGTDDV